MKKIIKLSLAILVSSMLQVNNSYAAFPVKQQTSATQQQSGLVAVEEGTINNQKIETSTTQKATTKSMDKKGGSTIPKVLYIVLAILGWGWLGMGINDSFGGYDWLISLLLYFLFYIPGLIYTLIKMKKYYK